MNAYVGLFPGFAYIEYENPEDAKAALRHMDGGQIDGQEVTKTKNSVTVHSEAIWGFIRTSTVLQAKLIMSVWCFTVQCTVTVVC